MNFEGVKQYASDNHSLTNKLNHCPGYPVASLHPVSTRILLYFNGAGVLAFVALRL